MKNFLYFLLALLSASNINFAQTSEYPTHLLLGEWVMKTDKDITTEIWDINSAGDITGKTIYEYDKGSFQSETMRLITINDKLNYCATIIEQDAANPQGEICFELKSYADRKFIFENLKHDFPKRIIYDFSDYDVLKARVEGDTSGFDLTFQKKQDFITSYTLKGRFIKEQFVNKAGRKIDGVFDYFFEIQGEKYFIKFTGSFTKVSDIESVLGNNIRADIIFKEGLWDTDDPNVQSRVGKYITITKIIY